MWRRPKELVKAKRGSAKGTGIQLPGFIATSANPVITQDLVSNAPEDAADGQSQPPAVKVHDDLDWLYEVVKYPEDAETLKPKLLTENELASIEKSSTKSIYRPLTPWQTRLLKLHPGEDSSPLSCSMVEVNVIDGHGVGVIKSDGSSEIVSFDALSYSWGYPAPVCSISCNETPLGLALELATALLYLRSTTENRYIWCDAICINQKDLVEKAQQVKIMLRIFEKADLVVAWLGKPCLSAGRLFEAMKLVNSGNSKLRGKKLDEKQLAAVQEIRVALKTHLASAWFLRTWCRQEVYASKKLTIQIGPYKITFELFLQRLNYLKLICDDPEKPDLQITTPSTLQVYKRDYQHRGTDRHDFERQIDLPSYIKHWIDVLRAGSLFQVSDERDRIYGALGLLTSMSVKFFARLPPNPETLAAAFPIDYKKELSEVYQDVTKFLINTSQTLEILDIFRDRRGMEAGKLPSWATDWSCDREEHGLFHRVSHPRYGFKDVIQQDYKDTGRLRLAGIRVAQRLISVDSEKDISHPRDRFKPKYRRPITLQDIMKGLTRRTRSGLASEIHNPPYSFIFTHVEESETAFEMFNLTMNPEDIDPPFTSWLAGSNYAFAYVEDQPGDASLDLTDLHLLVPRNVQLDDVVVSLYGSRCLHLLRPIYNSMEFRYIGPVAAVACGQEMTLLYSAKGKHGRKSISKLEEHDHSHKRETFVIV
jgi:hypothetical protein